MGGQPIRVRCATMRSPRPPIGAAILTLGALALGACGGDEDTTSTTTTTAATPSAKGCEEVPAAEPKKVHLKAPKEQVQASEQITATVETNCGSFDIELDTQGSPKTASSFVHLVDEGLYDGTSFHRVVDGFVIQGGDPAGSGKGGPGYSVVEKPPVDAEYTEGTVAMAKSPVEPDGTSGSQFFVVTVPDAGLPAQYAILGEVSNGLDTVKRIEGLANPDLGPEGGEPVIPVVIDRITLER
jgi:peptidyl-prolyl cis-trans isomerase B (cyclophilin B)